jgi:hypothetical protein
LFTIVVRSQITNKGVPVCFFITDRENQPVFVQWLNWIISVVGELSVKIFLVDCSATEISAIKEVLRLYFTMSLTYQTSLRKKMETEIKVQGSTQESVQARSKTRSMLNSMMYCEDEEAFEVLYSTIILKTNFKSVLVVFSNVSLINGIRRSKYGSKLDEKMQLFIPTTILNHTTTRSSPFTFTVAEILVLTVLFIFCPS